MCFGNLNIQKIACMGSVSWRQVSVKSGYKAFGGGHGFRGGGGSGSGHGFRGRHGSGGGGGFRGRQYRILSREKEVDIIFAKSSFPGKFNVKRESELCSGKDYII